MTDTEKDTGTGKRPEAIRLMLLLFAVAVGGEIIHQILNITIGFMDRPRSSPPRRRR